MPAPNSNKVRVGKPMATGGFLIADLGTALPSGPSAATATLDTAFEATGYVGEDGVTQTIGRDTQPIVAWGGDEVRIVQTTHSASYKLTFLEMTETTLKAVFGDDNVTVNEATTTLGERITALVNNKELPRKAFVIEIKDGDAKIRIVIPVGQITEVGDVNLVHTDAIKFEVTISCYPDDAGNKAYLYCDDGQTTTV